MPARPPVAGVIRSEWLWTQSGVPAANVLHIGYSSAPPSVTDLTTLATDLQNFISSYLLAYVPVATIQTEVINTDLSSDTANVGVSSTPTAGAMAGSELSAQASLMINFTISRRYRGGKPRIYLPAGTSPGLATQSTWSSTYRYDLGLAWASMKSHVEGQTFGSLITTSFGCVSYRTGGAARVVPIFEPFVGYAINGVVRTQRRRLTASSF